MDSGYTNTVADFLINDPETKKTIRERPLMTSDDFPRFLTYLPTLFNPKTSDFFGSFLTPPTYPKIGRH